MKENQFKQFAFSPSIEHAIEQLGFLNPTPIQTKAIPHILKGESVIGRSQTGSGKTHAYLLPLFQQLNRNLNEVQIVITLPTRELAIQIFEEVKKLIQLLNQEAPFSAKLLIGGKDKQRMIHELKNPPQIVVGTPGRILDLIQEEVLSIYSATSFVIDEADLMLDLGFIETIDQLLVRSRKDIQLLVFSATIPVRLEHFFKKYLKQPVYVKIEDEIIPKQIEHRLIAKKYRDEFQILNDIRSIIQPYLAIIFTNGKEKAEIVATNLQKNNVDVTILHGGLTPRERNRNLKKIHHLECQYIVATDLASRGIDIKGVSHVINLELPKEEHFYVHRAGRTARAGMDGDVISIYDEQDIPLIKKLENKGIHFQYVEVKNRQWETVREWNHRKKRKDNFSSNIEEEAWKRIKKPKKVKPGYKKKMKQEQQKIKNKLIKESKRKRK